ncbi:MAG: PAS domain S-box protein [Candidatus Krumholzibacteriia bacterium]
MPPAQPDQDLLQRIARLEAELGAQRRAGDLMRAELQILETATQSLPGIFYLFDATGKFLRWNRNFETVSGYAGDELAEMNPLDFFCGPDRERVASRIAEVFASGRSSVEAEFVTKDGRRIDHYFTGVLATINGEAFLVGMGIDTSELKRTEETLRNFQLAVESAADAIGFSTREGRHYYQNRAFDELFGHIGEDPPARLYADEQTGREVFRTLQAGGQWIGETRMIGRDGRTLDIFLRAYAIKDPQGKVAGLVGVHTDITASKRAEEEKHELELRLQQAQRLEAVGTLAGGIAHDFNNILAAILGNAEMAAAELGPGHPASHLVGQVLQASARARDLVHQILTFSRQADHEQRPVDLAGVVAEGLRLLRATIPTTIEIRQTLAADVGAVLVDPTRIHQVVLNLCTNAAHAMRGTGGVLGVDLRSTDLASREPDLDLPPGRYARLTVSDTGLGIAAESIDRIFEPYYTTKDKGVGTGLGLSVAHGIIKDHGGAITVTSEVGRGTTFTVHLPQVAPRPAPASAPEAEAAPPCGTERILLVDDEPAIVELVERMLGKLGYAVTTCDGSAAALALLRSRPEDFDLLITDQTMPGMTGLALATAVLRERPGMPIILCSGYSETVDEASVRAAGIGAYLAKPYTRGELATVLRSVLDAR